MTHLYKQFPTSRINPILIGLMLLLAAPGFAQVSGTVFRDFNANGIKDSTATYFEPGLPGVKVTAYGPTGSVVGTAATSGPNGKYSIPGATGDVRLEFTNLEAGDFSSGSASKYGSSVQFTKAPKSGINFAVNYPDNFCQPDPLIVIPCYTSGNVEAHVLVTFPYSYAGDLDGNINGNVTAQPTRDAGLAPEQRDWRYLWHCFRQASADRVRGSFCKAQGQAGRVG